VEILSTCPINWAKKPLDSIKWLDEEMTKIYPLGTFKDSGANK
jgi:hypothetical protein